MEETTIEKQLNEILQTGDFARLQVFRDEGVWDSMSQNERDLLSMLFVIQGESQLKQGDSKVFDNFNIASKISPSNPIIFFRQAMIFALNSSNMHCLNAACSALEKAVTIDPDMFASWSAWGCVLIQIGVTQGDISYFHDAIKKFEEAEARSDKAEPHQRSELYWQWGNCWVSLGKISGEAHDFHLALGKYRRAAELGLQHPDFWKQYGDALAEMAILMGKTELFMEAGELFRNAIKLAPDSFHGWLGLACCYQRLFEYYREGVYFDLSNEAFVKSSEIDSECVDLWLNWGILLSEGAKFRNDQELFQISYEKFSRANTCEENNPIVFSRWGEAQMHHGAVAERIDLMRAAEAKIIKSLEIQSDNADTWYIYGSCLTEIGRYFADPEFYRQAIEKFEYGLTLNQAHIWIWNGLALANYALGELLEEVAIIEKAVRHCAKVVEYGGQPHQQFWNDWGVSLMKLAEMTDDKNHLLAAIEKFEKAIGKIEDEKSHCDIEWLYNYGCAFDLLGSFTGDIEAYERAVHILSTVVQQDSTYQDARYNLALSLSHLGEWTDDVELLMQSLEHFQVLLNEDNEMECGWHDWGLTLIHLGELVSDPSHPEKSQQYFIQAEDKLLHAVSLGSTSAFYSLACLHSLTGNHMAAMNFIERADQAHSLPSIDEIMHDEWLEALRHTPNFRNFITLLRKGS